MSTPTEDQQGAAAEHRAREQLLESGASELPRAPWLHPRQPPSAVDLVRFAVWRGQAGQASEADVRAGLALLPGARAELEQIEAALLFIARAQGMSWGRISRAMGLLSAQAAQQRANRVAGRVESRGGS